MFGLSLTDKRSGMNFASYGNGWAWIGFGFGTRRTRGMKFGRGWGFCVVIRVLLIVLDAPMASGHGVNDPSNAIMNPRLGPMLDGEWSPMCCICRVRI